MELADKGIGPDVSGIERFLIKHQRLLRVFVDVQPILAIRAELQRSGRESGI